MLSSEIDAAIKASPIGPAMVKVVNLCLPVDQKVLLKDCIFYVYTTGAMNIGIDYPGGYRRMPVHRLNLWLYGIYKLTRKDREFFRQFGEL